jgi:hypothetical protein
MIMADPVKSLNELIEHVDLDTATKLTAVSRYIEVLEQALKLYQRERERFSHAKPEISGAYFLSGGHGETDENELPKFVRICPAYGCAWEQIYERTDKTITYEGS